MLLRRAAPSAAASSTGTIDRGMAEAASAAAREDWEAALAIWVKHAHAGVPRAQAEIGRCFVQGWGVARDVGLAERWVTLAAHADDALGQSLLGDFHFNGEAGTPNRAIAERDVAVAARWWRKAAVLGDADGQAMLGAAHHLGAGVARDPVTALAWLMRARAAPSPFADRFYAGIREACTAEQIREAERRAGLPPDQQEAAP